MSTLLAALVALPALTTKVPDPADVKPGWLGFSVVLVLAIATVLLWLSFRKQLKKIRFDDGSEQPGEQTQQGENGEQHPHEA